MGDGRIWQRVKRRDRSLGAASPVRQVEVTPDLERAALQALTSCGPPVEAPPRYQGEHWQRVERSPVGASATGQVGIGRARSRPNQQALPTRDRGGQPPGPCPHRQGNPTQG